MERAWVIFSAPSDPRELSVMKPRSCGVQRSSSRTCRTHSTRSRFGHLTSTVLMPEKEIAYRIARSAAPSLGHFTAIRPINFTESPPDKRVFTLRRRAAACPGALRSPSPASPAGPVPGLWSAIASLQQLSSCFRWQVTYTVCAAEHVICCIVQIEREKWGYSFPNILLLLDLVRTRLDVREVILSSQCT